MKLLYIAGPFGAPTRGGIEANISAAGAYALVAWKRGWAVICPHKNTSGFQDEIDIPDSVWYRGDLEILRRCDAVLMIPGWRESKGATAEYDLADRLHIPTFEYEFDGIPSPGTVLR